MKNSPGPTLIVGASENPDRYSYKAARSLLAAEKDIVLLGNRSGSLFGQTILTGKPELSSPDTITLYIGPKIQEGMMDYLIGLKPRRIIFNPGTENPEFERRALEKGILVQEACTLVLLATNAYDE
jgi:predicted CoA-binding protein